MTNELLLASFVFLIVAIGCILYLLIATFGRIADLSASLKAQATKCDRLAVRLDALEQAPQPAPAEPYRQPRKEKRRSPKPRIPDDLYDQCERLLKEGTPEKEVVEATGVSKSTVYRIHKRLRERMFKQWLKDNEAKKQTSANEVLEPFRDETQTQGGGEE